MDERHPPPSPQITKAVTTLLLYSVSTHTERDCFILLIGKVDRTASMKICYRTWLYVKDLSKNSLL